MKKQFVPYELALKIKELGFDEECFGCYYQAIEYIDRDYHRREDRVYNEGSPIYFTTGKYYKEEKYSNFLVGVPLWQQAFDWFEKEHKLHVMIETVLMSYGIVDCRNNDTNIIRTINHNDKFVSKLELRTDALNELIKLAKNDTK